MDKKIITVFGSSMPLQGEKEYEDAYQLGRLLAQNGFNVCSGGFQGIMDAVSKGATEEGTEAIGITVNMFNSTASKYLTKEIKCVTLFERIDKLITYGDAFIILPGGTGTLVELSIVWELINKNIIGRKPIACLGNMWRQIIELMEHRIRIENRQTGLVNSFNSIEEIVSFIIKSVKSKNPE